MHPLGALSMVNQEYEIIDGYIVENIFETVDFIGFLAKFVRAFLEEDCPLRYSTRYSIVIVE
jgi:hypothetical protein